MGDSLQMQSDGALGQTDTIVAAVVEAVSTNTNSTTKYVPTTEGMACAYLSLMIMALVPIFVGSFKSIRHQVETHANFRETGEQADTMTDKDAAIFPIIASCALFGFYILMKLSPDLVNLAVSGYFFILGVLAIYRIIQRTVHKLFPKRFNSVQYTFLFGSKSLISLSSSDVDTKSNSTTNSKSSKATDSDSDDKNEDDRHVRNQSPTGSGLSNADSELLPTDIMICSKFTPSDILAFLLASLLGVWYLWTKHWVANNAFGLAFALNGIELLPVNTVRIGSILLIGLFFYDVFWVFCTDVMVSVAKKFDAPIKIVFPQDFLVSGFWGKNFAMLGLGDIVIPGIYIAFLLRFDKSLNRGKNVYFWSCFLAYIFGLALTIGVMSYFKHAQPALLYLVPCCILTPFGVAISNGDLGALLKYKDHPSTTDNEIENKDENDDEDNDDKVDKKETKRRSARKLSTRAGSKKDK